MKKYRVYNGKYLAASLLIGLGMLFFYLSAVAWGSFIWTKDSVMFYLEQPLSSQEALAAMEQNQKAAEEEGGEFLNFCLWGQKENIILSNESLSAAVQVNGVFLCGKPELLFEDCSLPVPGDGQGCLIDEETAWKLFGDTQVTGKEISYEGKRYVIRGVIKSSERMAAFQVSKNSFRNKGELPNTGESLDDGASLETGAEGSSEPEQETDNQQGLSEENLLTRLTVQKPEHFSIYDLQSVWENQYNFPVKILDLELLRGIGAFCVLLFPITVFVFFGVYLYHQYRVQKDIPQKVLGAGLILFLLVLFLILCRGWVNIPDDYIPTRWSEFSFWTELWEGKMEGIRRLLWMPKSSLDDRWMKPFFQTAGRSLLAEMLLMIGCILLKYGAKFSEKEKMQLPEFY